MQANFTNSKPEVIAAYLISVVSDGRAVQIRSHLGNENVQVGSRDIVLCLWKHAGRKQTPGSSYS